MKYLGGKSRVSKPIAAYLNSLIGSKDYLEPFVGAGWVLTRIKANNRTACDINKPLMIMWQELQKGWIPPENISEEDYKLIKDSTFIDPALKAFVGFGCSWGGKWFGGYARCKTHPRNYCAEAKRSLLKKILLLKDVKFEHKDFFDIEVIDTVIYCDPPYRNTTGYDAVEKFDNDKFWDKVRDLSKYNTVLISEYEAPADFKIVLEINTKTDLSNAQGQKDIRTERLFQYNGS